MAAKELDIDAHKVSVEELCKRFNTNIETGLTDSQASEGLEKYGPNELKLPPPPSEKITFCKFVFLSPVTFLMWLGSFACFVAFTIQAILYEEPSVARVKRAVQTHSVMDEEFEYEGIPMGNCYIGIILCCLAIITGVVNYYIYTEIDKNSRCMVESYPRKSNCRRNGRRTSVCTNRLTLGDILDLNAGDVVPADVRILKSTGFRVDNSALTGESEPQLRSPECSHDNPLETKNLAFSSTSVTSGKAVAMVVNIGENTVNGRIAGLATVMETAQSGATHRFIIILSVVTLIIDVALFVVAYLFPRYNWIYAVIFFVGLIPVGINAKIKKELWSTIRYLLNRNCYVKSHEAIENLGSVSCLLTSQTGVITQNRLSVYKYWMDNQIVNADTSGERHMCDLPYEKTPGWKILSRVASLCNSAEFKEREESSISLSSRETIGGNATDAAILKCCEHDMGNVMEYRDRNKMVAEIPFNSYNKYQVTIHETEDANDERYLVAMKGAPEIIWEKCSTILVDGEDKPITQEWKKAFEEAVSSEGFANWGYKVIGFCDLMLPTAKYPRGFTFDPDDVNFPLQDMRFVGLMSMYDQPKFSIPDAVASLRNEYGIKVIMATGDHPVTALAIARIVGIVSPKSQTKEEIAKSRGCDVEDVEASDADVVVVTGEQLRNLSHRELVEIMKNCGEIVFARVSGYQRMSIVEACHSLGLRVAVAGLDKDDIPSLKMADVGIVMGSYGDQSAFAAADMILLNADFDLIRKAVKQTREIIVGKLKQFL